MKVDVGGFALNCEVEGKEGAPWITFSHALGNNLHLWDSQVDMLKDRFHILRYDHRGHGGSDAQAFGCLLDGVQTGDGLDVNDRAGFDGAFLEINDEVGPSGKHRGISLVSL